MRKKHDIVIACVDMSGSNEADIAQSIPSNAAPWVFILDFNISGFPDTTAS